MYKFRWQRISHGLMSEAKIPMLWSCCFLVEWLHCVIHRIYICHWFAIFLHCVSRLGKWRLRNARLPVPIYARISFSGKLLVRKMLMHLCSWSWRLRPQYWLKFRFTTDHVYMSLLVNKILDWCFYLLQLNIIIIF